MDTLEIHLSRYAELPRGLRARIVRAGGRVSDCRGNADTRYIWIPRGCPDLARQVLGRSDRPIVVITRQPEGGQHTMPAWVLVHRWRRVEGVPVDPMTWAWDQYDRNVAQWRRLTGKGV